MSIFGFSVSSFRWFLAAVAAVLITTARLCATLPTPWADADIGTVASLGSAVYDSTTATYTIKGAGSDIGGTADNFHFAYQLLSGDGSIMVRVHSVTNTHTSAKAGLMIRETLAAGSKNALMMVTPGAGAGMQWRSSVGGSTSQVLVAGIGAPRWLKLERRGKVITGFESVDGLTWTVVQRVALAMTSDVYVGIAASSRTSALTTVMADNFSVDTPDPDIALPWPWVEQTVGTPTDAGVALYDGSYVLSNLGADISETSDKLKFASQTLVGDGTLTVQISSVNSADSYSKLGLMMRESASASVKNVFLGINTAKSVVFIARPTAGGTTNSLVNVLTVAVPAWLRLERVGNVFTAWRSTDGVNWVSHGSTTLVMPASIQVGLAYANRSTATWAIGVGDSLKLTTPSDTDGNGLGDDWETLYFGAIGADASADPDGDGLTNAQEWELGNDPHTFNASGQFPVIEVVSGNTQAGQAGTILSSPMVVRVKDSLTGAPMAGVPVLWRVTQGEGRLGSVQPGSISLSLVSDASGYSSAAFILPATAGENAVSVRVGGGPQTSSVGLTASSLVGESSLLFRLSDLGSPALPAQTTYAAGKFTLTGATVLDNSGNSDNSAFVWRELSGNGYVLARASFVDATNASAQVGLMMRSSLDAGSPDAAMLLTLSNGLSFRSRSTAGGGYNSVSKTGVTGPVWLLLRRNADTISGFYSTDGMTWLLCGSRVLALGESIKIGLTLGTRTTVYNSAALTGLRIGALAEAPWTVTDIGSVGAAAVNDYTANSVLMRAGGTDINGTADGFQFLHHRLAGDGRLTVRIPSMLAVSSFTKGGVMVRESLDANSRHASMMIASGAGALFRTRAQQGGASTGSAVISPAPQWLRVERFGPRVNGYLSSDGVTWSQLGSATLTTTGAPYIGLVSSSYVSTTHTQTLFDNVVLETGDGALGWNAAYYEGRQFNAARHFRRDASLDFTWSAGATPAPGVGAGDYSVRWTGDVLPAHSETYTLKLLSQGSARVIVNGQTLIDRWSTTTLGESTTQVALLAGTPVSVVVEYANTTEANARVRLSWSSASQPEEPLSFLSVRPLDADDDGIPDAWETAHGLNPNDPADATLDPDGDNLTNLQEYQLGGNPAVADANLPGAVFLEQWTGIAGKTIFNLTRDAKFHAAANSKRAVTLLETSQNQGDNFGQRLRGYIVPPANGAYQFWVSADESAELWLSPDDSPFTRVKIARLTEGATAYRAYTTRAEQHSQPITLQGGQRYYFEVLHKENTGSDHLSVAWTRPGETSPEVITGAYLEPYAGSLADTDDDGLPDVWQAAHGLGAGASLTSAASGAYGDADGDRLVNLLEYQRGLDPLIPDTDGDGYDDYLEVLAASDPLTVSNLNLAPWQLADVGLVNGLAIANRLDTDAFQVAGTGSGLIQHEPDSFRFLYRQITGDFEFTTRMVRPASSPVGYGGVTVRSSLDPQAASFTVFQDAKGRNSPYVRTTDEADLVELGTFTPAYGSEASSLAGDWLRLRREGNVVRFFYSTDGQHWMQAATKTLALGENCVIGMVVCRSLDTITGNADTELPVRQFRDVSLIADLTPPASPETVPPEATATVTATINGSAGVTVKGQWAANGNDLVSQIFTGTLDYTFTAAVDGLYRLTFTALSTSNATSSVLFPVEISVDGQFVARVDLVLPLNEEGLARIITPWLKAGTHTVRLFYDNTLSYHPLTIRSLTVEQLGGVDADANGRADWIDARLAALNTLESAGSVYVSPASLTGRALSRSLLTLKADGVPVTVKPAPGYGWYADVPLSETAPVEVVGDFENSGSVQGLLLPWAPINLLVPPEDLPGATIRIRKGDSLRLTAHPIAATGGTATVTISKTGATPVVLTLADPSAQSVTQAFTTAGTYMLEAVYSAGGDTETAEPFTVEVIEAAFASDPTVGLNNTPLTWDNPRIFDNVLLEIDQGLQLVKTADLAGGGTRFSLGTSNVADSYIVARLGEDGPVFGHATVHSLRAATVSDTAMDLLQSYPDGSILYGVPVIVNRLTDDTVVTIAITTQGVTFEDGTIVKTLTKADFDAYGRIYLKFIYPAGVAGSICHVVRVHEGTTDLGQF
jgi:regulation of enolase protein 1 (concanavalin A-like superfamily)